MNINIIKNIMHQKSISIKKLSKIAQLNDSHIGKIINGKTKNPGIEYIVAIAKAMKLSDEEFCELCGYKTPNQETQKSTKENIE